MDNLTLIHERVDDIPLLFGLMVRLGLPELLDRFLGNHGLHQGLSNGWLATIWLIFMLSEGDHRKSTVQDWVERHRQTLERLLEQPIRAVDFTDDRLGIVLRRLSKTESWDALEAELWGSTVTVYEPEVAGVRIDSTTVCGYHVVTEDGVMQHGQSKDHRPDLAQLKLMAAAVEGTGQLVACDVLPGNRADDGLYQPIIARVRQILGRSGLLYTGDCKMSAFAIRADVVAHGDYYLTPLAQHNRALIGDWVDRIVEGELPSAELLWHGERLLGAGYEFERRLSAEVEGEPVQWVERVHVVRSRDVAGAQCQHLDESLSKAEATLRALTPVHPGRKRQYADEASLQDAISDIEARYKVDGLLRVTWRREEKTTTRYVGPGRGAPNRPRETEVRVRYRVTNVERDEAAIARRRHRLGWRIYVTNMSLQDLSLSQTAIHYRQGWSLERDYHLVKDRPLGISPLYVRNDDQIVGLTRLLTLGVRLLTLIETQVRLSLAQAKESMAGLYPGQPTRVTDRPTATRLLRAFVRNPEITLTRIEVDGQHFWHITPLSSLQEQILAHLGLPTSLYEDLAHNSS